MGHPPLVAVCRRGIGSGTGKAACFRESTPMPVFLHTTPSKEEAVAESNYVMIGTGYFF